jgi:hypothetical protein
MDKPFCHFAFYHNRCDDKRIVLGTVNKFTVEAD